MYDCAITGGSLIDGTGIDRRRADIGIRGGVIVAVGELDEPASRTIDADGLIVAPGFIDPHTHLDAQVFWDPDVSPLAQHGVTTIIGGHCGFSIAPVAPDHADYLMRLLSRVEEIPLETVQQGVDWGSWQSFGQFLDRLDRTTAVNVGFMAGHSAIRRCVMGDAAVGGSPNEDQMQAMERLLGESLAGGALGLSSSDGKVDMDGNGQPVPSRWADEDELLRLCRVLQGFPGTTIEYLPKDLRVGDQAERMTKMALAANRSLIWNLFHVRAGLEEVVRNDLAASDYAAARGARVVALGLPGAMRLHLTFSVGSILEAQPGWDAVRFSLPHAERIKAFSDPAVRQRLREGAAEVALTVEVSDFASYIVEEVFADANQRHLGRAVGDIARERGADPLDTLLDIALADDLRTLFAPCALGADEESWRQRAQTYADPRVLVGGTDAGAHLTLIDTFILSTELVGPIARDRQLITLEAAVRKLTAEPAEFLGLRRRGIVAPGYNADIVVFDADRIGPATAGFRSDLPAGARRLYAEALGIEHVLVNGREIVRGNRFTGERPGRALRSGQDTQ
ncbi:MAG: amidohydrolase family protein [Acidimicrobiales bacterium]